MLQKRRYSPETPHEVERDDHNASVRAILRLFFGGVITSSQEANQSLAIIRDVYPSSGPLNMPFSSKDSCNTPFKMLLLCSFFPKNKYVLDSRRGAGREDNGEDVPWSQAFFKLLLTISLYNLIVRELDHLAIKAHTGHHFL